MAAATQKQIEFDALLKIMPGDIINEMIKYHHNYFCLLDLRKDYRRIAPIFRTLLSMLTGLFYDLCEIMLDCECEMNVIRDAEGLPSTPPRLVWNFLPDFTFAISNYPASRTRVMGCKKIAIEKMFFNLIFCFPRWQWQSGDSDFGVPRSTNGNHMKTLFAALKDICAGKTVHTMIGFRRDPVRYCHRESTSVQPGVIDSENLKIDPKWDLIQGLVPPLDERDGGCWNSTDQVTVVGELHHCSKDQSVSCAVGGTGELFERGDSYKTTDQPRDLPKKIKISMQKMGKLCKCMPSIFHSDVGYHRMQEPGSFVKFQFAAGEAVGEAHFFDFEFLSVASTTSGAAIQLEYQNKIYNKLSRFLSQTKDLCNASVRNQTVKN